MAQAIQGHLLKTCSETFLHLANFTHLFQVIGPVKSKVLSKQQQNIFYLMPIPSVMARTYVT